jgi:hypothetical protein
MAAPFPSVRPLASTSRDTMLVVPAEKLKRGRVPPPLMTVGTSVRPLTVTLFVIGGN